SWAFGCVLYELLTGQRAFRGETTGDVVAGGLEREPDWSALPVSRPPLVTRLLKRCLRKDPRQRFQDAGDVPLELDDAASSDLAAPASSVASRRSSWLPWSLAALLALAALGIGAVALRR